MATFDLYLDLSSVYTGTAPTFEILIDGVVVSSLNVTSSFTPVTLSSLAYSGDAPGYLSFRFNDADGEVDRSVTLNEVRINGNTVGGGSLSKVLLLQGQESQLDVAAEQASFGIPGPDAGTDALIDGTAAADILKGTTGNDTINGYAGNDFIKGLAGIDTVNGGDDHDVIRGGDGNDILNGDDGQDLIKGENDDDTINGGLGHDTLDGGAGADALNGGDGNDILKGGAGIDTLHGDNDNDKLQGGTEGDFLYGDAGNDKLYGEDGNDTLYGGTGNDTLFGGNGNDIIDGEADHDRLYGDAGQDTLYGRAGNDKIFGGADNDTIFGGEGNDKLFGDGGDDTINGENGNDRIRGGDGVDTINGGDGVDNIDGDDGNDILSGGLMADLIKGGDGNDTINGDEGNDNLYGQAGNDTINGGDGDDFIYGLTGTNNIDGGIGIDTIHGGDGNDTIEGGTGVDVINAEGGNDTILAGAEAETLRAGAGADTVHGGDGNDVIHGHGMAEKDIKALLAANPNVVYNAQTNSFYQYVNTTADYATALAAAQGTTLNGVAGHLANITSAEENAFIRSLVSNRVWIAATDSVSNTDWFWTGGAEDGVQFSNGGTATNNLYENWSGGQPQNNTEHNAVFYTNGSWHDWPDTSSHRYVIEWDAGLMNDDNAIDTLNGGNGNDFIYGYGGDDIINGDANNDTLFGGGGNDTIDGGLGSDAIFGQDGNDIITDFFGTNRLYGGAGNDTITGGGGTDTLSGDDGDDTLNGGAGNDFIYGSNLAGTTTDLVADILAANAGVTFNESTGNFYQWVATTQTWTNANNAANAATLNGVNGHLAVVTSAVENDYLSTISSNARLWIGGNDATTEGEWFWTAGPEAGTQFWTGGAAGGAVGGLYSNWVAGDPSNGSGAWDYIEHRADGTWWSNANGSNFGYVIEWEGEAVLGTTGTDTILGRDGSDTLFGTDAVQDIFEFRSGETGSDTINNFTTADNDAIDISDLLTGYTAGVSDINDFIRFTNSGADSLVQVDANGTTGGSSYTTIATIDGINDLDADALLYNGSIIA